MTICAIDILVKLRTTFYEAGHEVVSPTACARHYILTGSFWFDLLCAAPFEHLTPLEAAVVHAPEEISWTKRLMSRHRWLRRSWGWLREQKAFKVSKNTLKAVTKDRRKITK